MRKCSVAALLAVSILLAIPTPGRAASQPILMVGGYRTTPTDIAAGEHFRLSLTIKNGTASKATNVLVRLGSAAPTPATAADGAAVAGLSQDPFVVLSRGDVRYIGGVKGHEDATVMFDLIADPRIGPGAYAVPVTIEYDSTSGHRREVQRVGVVITRSTTFDVTGLDRLGTLQSGASKSVKMEIVNSGAYPVKGVSLDLKGSGLTVAGGRMFVGRLDQSDGEVLEGRVTATSVGPQHLTLTITYIDDFNRSKSVTKEATITVLAAAESGAPLTSGAAPASQNFWGRLLSFVGLGD